MSVISQIDCNDCTNYIGLVKRLLFFNKISQNILEKKPLTELLKEILDSSKLLLNAEASSLLLYDKADDCLSFHTVAGEKQKELTHQKINMGEGIAGWVAKNKKPLKIDDCYIDPRFNKEFDLNTGFRTRNMICVPMMRKNELVGVIQVINRKNGEEFPEQDVDIFNILASECALAIENARLTEMEIKTEQLNYELTIAREIQQKILPDKLPEFDDITIKAHLTPAKEIGGDYYNVIRINKNETLFMVADVSGKSVPAALIVSTIYSFIQTYLIINKNSFDLKSFVESLNSMLITSTTQDKFATAWFGLYNHSEKTLQSVNAGHNIIYVYEKNENKLQELTEGGLLLGGLELPYQPETIKLASGDAIIFYTDGIPEAMDEDMEEYGDERFIQLISNNAGLYPAEIIDNIISDIKIFRGSAEPSDDITCGVVRIN